MLNGIKQVRPIKELMLCGLRVKMVLNVGMVGSHGKIFQNMIKICTKIEITIIIKSIIVDVNII